MGGVSVSYKVLKTVKYTYIIDHPDHLKECPYALLRERVRLTQYHLPANKFGDLGKTLGRFLVYEVFP